MHLWTDEGSKSSLTELVSASLTELVSASLGGGAEVLVVMS